MKLNGPLVTGAMSIPLWMFIRSWMSTLDYRVWYRDETVDPPLHGGPPKIFLFWHEGILAPLHLRGNCHVSMLLSKHRDADFLARVAGRFGFDCVRGSSNRGGSKALLELMRLGKAKHLTITPDGPRGPRRVCAPGPIYLASKLQMPIVAMGYAYERPWRLNSWDRFAVPKPFSRARIMMSEAITLPPRLDRAELEHWRMHVEQTMNQLTDEAQDWADSGAAREGEKPMRRLSADPPTQLFTPPLASVRVA